MRSKKFIMKKQALNENDNKIGRQYHRNLEGRLMVIKKWSIIIVLIIILSCRCFALADTAATTATAGATGKTFYFRGAFYLDWMGFKTGDSELYNRLSTRLNATLWNRPGDGWTMFIDVRNRYTMGEGGNNQLILYDVRLSFDSLKSKLFFALGQMNLYDTAGIGQLTGGLAGFKLNRYLAAGIYGGFEPDIYNTKWNTAYQKYGIFARYIGHGAKQVSLSYNLVRFESKNERQFIYVSALLPLNRYFILYGNVEYELDPLVKSPDRLSRLFVNARVNLTKYADVTAHYSSGRGLDYHQFLLEQSQDPTSQNNEIERFYYNETYGVRLSIKPFKDVRFYLSRQESTQKDLEIKNHTTGFGVSVYDLLKSGVSLYGNYNLNRGEASESDTYYISASKNFGKLSWSLSYANYYNGVRFSGSGTPEIVRILLPDQQTYSTDLFLILSRWLAISLDYSYLAQTGSPQHQFFVRLILRK